MQWPVQVASGIAQFDGVIADLDRRLAHLGREIATVLRDGAWAESAALLQSIPGIGPGTAAWLLVATMNFALCATPEAAVAYVGVNPLERQSGTSVRGRPKLGRAAQLRQLFSTMATGGYFGVDAIARFNGRLFEDDTVLDLDSDGLDILARVSQLRSDILEPSALGTLFERGLDPGKRAQLGAHYTSKADILLIVEPVLMAPLRRRWAAVHEQAQALAARRDTATGGQRTRLQNDLRTLLVSFAAEVGQVRVLDPACGSGNFLYVALKELLDLEKDVITAAGDLGVGTIFPTVSPEQLRGIELNEYAHELAPVTVWIGYIQWLRDNGSGAPSEPILKPLDTIIQMDAILAINETGQLVEPTWPDADVVVANPPFLGGKRLRRELSDDYVEKVFALYDGRVPREADLVTYWFEHTRGLIAGGKLQRAGLLATNSIRGGANRRILEQVKRVVTFLWRGATVLGFSKALLFVYR